jgi:hypothetical protein
MKIAKRSGLFVLALLGGGCGDLEDTLAPGEESLVIGESDPGVPGAIVGEDDVVSVGAVAAAAAPINALTWTFRQFGFEIGAEGADQLDKWALDSAFWRDPATGQVVNGCYQVKKWNGSSWTLSNGCGVRISVTRDTGVPWVVNHRGLLFYLPDAARGSATGAWVRYDNDLPCVSDFAPGFSGNGWAIGCDIDSRGNASIYKLAATDYSVDPRGRGVRIAMGPYTGRPWIRTAAGIVYRRSSAGISQGEWVAYSTSGRSRELTVGVVYDPTVLDRIVGERVWVVNRVAVPGGSGTQIQYRDGSTWYTVNGGARDISTYSGTFPWIVDAQNQIYQAR